MNAVEREEAITKKLSSLKESIDTAEKRKKDDWKAAHRRIINALNKYKDMSQYMEKVYRPSVDPHIQDNSSNIRFSLSKADRACLKFALQENGYVQASIETYERDDKGRQVTKVLGCIAPNELSSEFAESMVIEFLDYCLTDHPSLAPTA